MARETNIIEMSESRSVVECRSASPVRSVKSSTSSGKKAKKTKFKTVVAAVVATQELESNLSGDHPYVSVVYKRIRSHRKKLEKIKTLEQAKANEGKVPNAQQLELMSNKTSLEKLVAELEMLREQFLVVYRQEGEQKLQEEASVAAVEEEVVQLRGDEQLKEKEEDKGEVQEQEKQQVEDFANVFELLKTLHVVNLHQALGKEVPMVLDFFSKVLLGNTRPPAELSYEENLMESLEEAKKYLTESDKVFACDTTYSGLRAFVDQLASSSSGKNDQEDFVGHEGQEETVEEAVEVEASQVEAVETVEEVVEETSDVPVVPAEINTMPEISFFAESKLEEEQSDEIRAEVEQAEAIEVSEVVVPEVQVELAEEINDRSEDVIEEQVEVAVKAPPAPESIPAPPLSFAAVPTGVESERTSSPTTSSGSSTHEKEAGPDDSSPRGKNSKRRRGQGRWREKGSNSNNGNKSGDGSPTNGGKPRRHRGPRTNDENSVAQGGKLSGSKEGRRPRVDRALRKQGNPSQQHAAPMIAPHA